jgi:glycosyltransferase 2 family protein
VVTAAAFVVLALGAARGDLVLGSWRDRVDALAPWVVQGCVVVVVGSLLVALFVVAVAAVQFRSDITFLRDLAAAASVTVVLSYVVSLAVVDGAVDAGVLDASRSALLDFPDLLAAAVTAVVVAAIPHVARPNRRLLWALLLVTAACGSLTDPAALVPVAGGVLLGIAVASAWLALLGSPAGLPNLSTVRAALAEQGIVVDATAVGRGALWSGALTCFAAREDGSPVRIKVYGRDAVASDFWVRLYRRVTYLDAQRTWSARRIDLVEHEAVVTAAAQQFGVPVTPLVAVSDWSVTDPFVAVEWPGTSLSDIPADTVNGELVGQLWTTIAKLHGVGMVHGQLDAEAFRVGDDGSVRLANLDRARFSTDKRLRDRDLANLLVMLAAIVGPDRAVADADENLGTDRLDDLAPYLEPAAIRVSVQDVDGGLKSLLRELRDRIAEQTGTPPPPPAVLKRLTLRRLLAMALVVLAVFAMANALAGIDFAAVADEVADATWLLVVLALIVGQLVLIPEALATTCLVPERLPFGPLVALQSAMRFLGLAVPGPAARVAANVAFLRKQGVVVSRSLTLGVVDSSAGLLVELLILVLAAAVGDLSLALFGIEPIDVNWAALTWALIALIGVAALVLRFVEPVRSRAVVAWSGVREVLTVLKDSPSRTTALIATNLTSRLISSAALWLVLQSLGVSLDFLAVLVVIAASNLLSGLIPVPGNVGVAEAALTTFLVAAGVPEDTAFAAAVVYRVCVAYLPPVWGAGAQRWLLRHDYI